MNKRKIDKEKPVADNAVVTNTIYALGVFAILFVAMNRLIPYYQINRYLFDIKNALVGFSIGFAVVAVAALVAGHLLRGKRRELARLAMAVAALTGLAGATAWVLYTTWTAYVSAIYVFYGVALVLYLIHLVYPPEFFLISKSNAFVMVGFYLISKSFDICVMMSVLAAILVAIVGYAYLCLKKPNKIFRLDVQAPVPVYANGLLWAVCLLGVLVLGSLFAYFCLFAVGAVQLVFAVYYTVKLS